MRSLQGLARDCLCLYSRLDVPTPSCAENRPDSSALLKAYMGNLLGMGKKNLKKKKSRGFLCGTFLVWHLGTHFPEQKPVFHR